jgi:hypothetical protein
MSETAPPEPEQEGPTALGLHEVSRERDLHLIRLRGALSEDEAAAFHSGVARTIARYGSAYVLVDSCQAGSISPQTRRWIAEWNQTHPVGGVAIFGSSLVVRAVLTLVLNAIALLRRQAVPSVFVKTEAEARAWIASLRRPHSPAR